MTYNEENDYQNLLKNIKIWEKLGVVAPMACNELKEPIFDGNLALGSIIYIPAFSQGWDRCIFSKDKNGYYAQSEYDESYRLTFGPNWYVK